MKNHLIIWREVEEELNLHWRGPSCKSQSPASTGIYWEFRGAAGRFTQWMRRLGRRSTGGRSFASDPRQQRVIVKSSYTVHRTDKIAGVLRAHVRYLGRDSASLDGREGRFYDAAQETIDARQRVLDWQNDRHHFRFIVSPEYGHDIDRLPGGLKAYVRELVTRMERDLVSAGAIPPGMKLNWLAINHHNTDDLHAHLLLRGRREDGRDLVLPRQYIKHGMREAAQEIATRWLGPRSNEQVRQAMQKEVQADRYTSLDSVIERHVDKDRRLRLATRETGGELRRRVAGRLQHLEKMGLATRDRHGRWTVDAELKPKLRELAQRNDIIKNLYAALGPRSAFVASYRGEAEIIGYVAGKGTYDELRDRRYLLVRDEKEQLHYVRAANPEALAALEEGALVRIAGTDPQRARTDARIAEVARQNGGIYNREVHRRGLPEKFAAGDVEAFLRSHERRLQTLQRQGTASRVEGGWMIQDVEALARGERARIGGGLGVIQIISARSVQSHVNAQAWTWLDRQIHLQSRGKPTTVSLEGTLEQAAQARRAWMIERGYAIQDHDRYTLRRGAAAELREKEWREVEPILRQRFNRTLHPLAAGAEAEGKYCGVVSLHSGLYAAVAGQSEVYLAPIARVPPLGFGAVVRVKVSAQGKSILTPALPRQPAQTLERE